MVTTEFPSIQAIIFREYSEIVPTTVAAHLMKIYLSEDELRSIEAQTINLEDALKSFNLFQFFISATVANSTAVIQYTKSHTLKISASELINEVSSIGKCCVVNLEAAPKEVAWPPKNKI